jgi:hypothetical protein
MENTGKGEEKNDKKPRLTKERKKRKTEPEVTIAPSQPGGPDVSVE